MPNILSRDPAPAKHGGCACGAIAFSRTGDPKTGEFEPALILKRFGDVPTEDALMGYE